ncbi:hypothetical protein Tco_1047909 [Tanacetum coccineum]
MVGKQVVEGLLVVKVENFEIWSYFISFLAEDLELGHGIGITIISDSHKGLLDAVFDWLPNAEHRKYTRHVFVNFKKKFSGVQLQGLFWQAAGTTMESIFYNNMDQIKAITLEAYTYLSNTCSKNKTNHRNARRHKALYYTKIGRDEQKGYKLRRLNHTIYQKETKDIERTKKVLDSHSKWFLGARCIPCVHFVAAYLFLNKVHDEGVDHWYSQDRGGGKGSRRGRGQETGGIDEASGGRGQASGALGEASGALGEASGPLGEASGGRGQSNAARFQANTERSESSGGRGRARGRGGRGRGRGGRGRGRGVTTMLVDEEVSIHVKNAKEEKRIAAEKAIQEEFDEEVVSITPPKSASTMEECDTTYGQTQESIVDRGEPGWRLTKDVPTAEQSVSTQPSVAAIETTPKGKTIEADADEPPKLKK